MKNLDSASENRPRVLNIWYLALIWCFREKTNFDRAGIDTEIQKKHMENLPTVFHITHWKAGSQWVAAVLEECAPHRVVEPVVQSGHLLDEPIKSLGDHKVTVKFGSEVTATFTVRVSPA